MTSDSGADVFVYCSEVQRMRAIFISYRRDDAEGQAGRLFDDLVSHFGEGAVFMDVAGIEPGTDFRRAIDTHVASCGVLLAVIGKSWLDAKDESGRRRLEDAGDFVRLETASALKRDIPVVPVLVQDARMPRAEQLPSDLKELAFRNGVELTHARWDSDVQVLVKTLERHVKPNQEGAGASGSPKKSRRMAVVAALTLLAIVIAGYSWIANLPEQAAEGSQSQSPTDPAEEAADGSQPPTDPAEEAAEDSQPPTEPTEEAAEGSQPLTEPTEEDAEGSQP
jgi:TIR domain